MRYGGFWRRFAAFALDCAAIALLASGPDFLFRYVTFTWNLTGVAAVVLAWLYFAFFESSPWRATPGKKLLGLRVSDQNGRRVSFWRATVRFFSKFLSGAVFYAGFIMAAFTRRKRALHDYIAGTLVTRS